MRRADELPYRSRGRRAKRLLGVWFHFRGCRDRKKRGLGRPLQGSNVSAGLLTTALRSRLAAALLVRLAAARLAGLAAAGRLTRLGVGRSGLLGGRSAGRARRGLSRARAAAHARMARGSLT